MGMRGVGEFFKSLGRFFRFMERVSEEGGFFIYRRGLFVRFLC